MTDGRKRPQGPTGTGREGPTPVEIERGRRGEGGEGFGVLTSKSQGSFYLFCCFF